jgi:23S rRNA U2552 (ribose-2'-O)-methylase RlmE/FtsJ
VVLVTGQQRGPALSYGEITDEMEEVLAPLVEGKTVCDLGAGDLAHSHVLARLGAEAVIAVDKVPMRKPRCSEVSRLHGHFAQLPVPDHIDVAFLGWPQTYPLPGLLDWLDAADVVVYLGHNFDDSYCGSPELFFYLTRRALLDEVLGRRNTLLVLGDRLAEVRPMTCEEAAHFSRD